jgi:hypothetical protein
MDLVRQACDWRFITTVVGLVLNVAGVWTVAMAAIRAARGVAFGFSTELAIDDVNRGAWRAKCGGAAVTVGCLFQAVGSWPR